MTEILQSSLPVAPWMAAHTLRLPGTAPIDPADWLQRDDAYPEQMALRDRLIAERTGEVHAVTAGAEAAVTETL
jgi:dimethylamine monooxygenase subunit A